MWRQPGSRRERGLQSHDRYLRRQARWSQQVSVHIDLGCGAVEHVQQRAWRRQMRENKQIHASPTLSCDLTERRKRGLAANSSGIVDMFMDGLP